MNKSSTSAAERSPRGRASPDTLELARFLPYRLSVLSNLVSSAIALSYAARFDLSIPEWRVLAVLAADPGMAAADVATRTAMDKVAVSRAVASLLKSGRLTRAFPHSDRRRSRLELSESGRRVYDQVVPVARRHERDLYAVLSPAERRALDRILDRLQLRAAGLKSVTPRYNRA